MASLHAPATNHPCTHSPTGPTPPSPLHHRRTPHVYVCTCTHTHTLHHITPHHTTPRPCAPHHTTPHPCAPQPYIAELPAAEASKESYEVKLEKAPGTISYAEAAKGEWGALWDFWHLVLRREAG